MNIRSEIFSTNESNPFNFSACDTEDVTDFIMMFKLAVDIITLLLSFPINFYVIWLIVTGTGNGLAAEIFILNLCVCGIMYGMELVFSLFSNVSISFLGSIWFFNGFPVTGRPSFECLICVERYLAVVHPVIFLKYKPLRYRLMCSAGVWVICFCSCIFNFMTMFFSLFHLYVTSFFAQFFIFFSIQLFCCLAVLRALKQSGPGERGRGREEENNMKRKAFYLVLIITVTSFIIYAPYITLLLFDQYSDERCRPLGMPTIISYVFFLFAGLVQPLLFLYRVGKPSFIKCQ